MSERQSKYEYPGTDVLINIPDLRDAEQLKVYESIVTQERLVQLALRSNGDAFFDLAHLQGIHRFIFQDVYPFAGQVREEDISKDFFTFASTQYISSSASELFQKLHQENGLKGLDIDQFSERAAHYMAEINVLHPFRESNGRAQREFIRQLAEHAGYDLDWSRVDPQRLLRASIRSKIDTQDLIQVIQEVCRIEPSSKGYHTGELDKRMADFENKKEPYYKKLLQEEAAELQKFRGAKSKKH